MIELGDKFIQLKTANDIRNSIGNCYEYTISRGVKPYSLFSNEKWDILKEEFESIISKGIENFSDQYLEQWLDMARDLRFRFFYQHQLIGSTLIVQFIGYECFAVTFNPEKTKNSYSL